MQNAECRVDVSFKIPKDSLTTDYRLLTTIHSEFFLRKVLINMSVSKKDYAEMTKKASPKSPLLSDCVKAFLFGGGICAFAEGLFSLFSSFGISEKDSRSIVMIILIVITAILTATGVFDIIAKHAGAGTSVPISGFANSIVSSALEFQTEGRILGTAAQMFSIAGPVIVFGCSSAALYGFIIWLFG